MASNPIPVPTENDDQDRNRWGNMIIETAVWRGKMLREQKPLPQKMKNEYDVFNIDFRKSFSNQSRQRRRNQNSRDCGCSTRTTLSRTSAASTSPPKWANTPGLRKKHRKRCSLRIAELAIPSKRQLIDTWRNKADLLPQFMVERLKQHVMDQRPIVKIPEAYYCFQRRNSPQRPKNFPQDIKDSLAEVMKPLKRLDIENLCIIFGHRIAKELVMPLNINLSPKWQNLSNIIASDIAQILRGQNRMDISNQQRKLILMDISNKITVWISGILDDMSLKLLDEDLRVDKRKINVITSKHLETIIENILLQEMNMKCTDLEEEEGPVLDFIDDLVEKVLNICEPLPLYIFEQSESSNSTKDSKKNDTEEAITPLSLDKETDYSHDTEEVLTDPEHFRKEINTMIDRIINESGDDYIQKESGYDNRDLRENINEESRDDIQSVRDNISKESTDESQRGRDNTSKDSMDDNQTVREDTSKELMDDSQKVRGSSSKESMNDSPEVRENISKESMNNSPEVRESQRGRDNTSKDSMDDNQTVREDTSKELMDDSQKVRESSSKESMDNSPEVRENTTKESIEDITKDLEDNYNEELEDIDKEIKHDFNEPTKVEYRDENARNILPTSDTENEDAQSTDNTENKKDIEYIDFIERNDEATTEGNIDTDVGETAEEDSKNVKVSVTKLVSPDLQTHQFDISAKEEPNNNKQDQHSLWKANSKLSVMFAEPNEHLLSDADEMWPKDIIDGPSFRLSQTVSKSITSLGSIFEVDEKQVPLTKYKTEEKHKPDNIELQDDQLETIQSIPSTENTNSIITNEELAKSFKQGTTPTPEMTSENEKDISENEKDIYLVFIEENPTDSENSNPTMDGNNDADNIGGTNDYHSQTLSHSNIFDYKYDDKLPHQENITDSNESYNCFISDNAEEIADSHGKTRDRNYDDKLSQQEKIKTDSNKSYNYFISDNSEEIADSYGKIEDGNILNTKSVDYSYKVQLKTAPSWVYSRIYDRGEPSEDSIPMQLRPTQVKESDLRKWCKDLEKAFINLELWNDWIRDSCKQTAILLKRKETSCNAWNRKNAADWIRLKKNIKKDAMLWTKLLQRTEYNFRSLKKKYYNNIELPSNRNTLANLTIKEAIIEVLSDIENLSVALHRMIVSAEYCGMCTCNDFKDHYLYFT